MDNKAWLWKKKSTEKTIFAADSVVTLSSKENEEEIQILISDKVELEKELKISNDKLISALTESNAKDELVKKHANMACEAIANLEKAEAHSASLKQELDEAFHQIVTGEERLVHVSAALKECMQQLRFVREGQERRIHDAMTKTSKEFEKSKKALEDKLAETAKRLAKVGVENSHLSKALLVKEQTLEDLNKKKAEVESDLSSLMARLDSTERDNSSLRYEVRVLEKELEIRNEEREFNRRAADAEHKQHLEGVKKIAKLESECQRLRVLVRKRLPGPAALAKMKNEVDMMGSDLVEMRRRRSSPSPTGSPVSSTADFSPKTPKQRINFLTDQLRAMEEENKNLKESLDRMANELQLSHIRHARATTKFESQLQGSSRGLVSQDKASGSESWASALISELERFRIDKQKAITLVGASDMNLMDDFLEMEKLAVVSADKPALYSQCESELSKSICKIIELVDGINLSRKRETAPTGYIVRAFQWKVSEVGAVLQQFVQTCHDLLNGKADLSKFSQETASALDWIINHCFSIQDVSSMRDEIKKQFDWDESRSENEAEAGSRSQFSEADKLCVTRDQSWLPSTASNGDNDLSQFEELQSNITEENRKMKGDLERRLGLAISKSESLLNQLRESDRKIASLEKELKNSEVSRRTAEEQIENLKLVNNDLDEQLRAAKVELTEAYHKFSSLEAEMENKSSCYEELEAMCVELQLQLESRTNKETPNYDLYLEEKPLQTGWEISAASEKLAECQETILNLGKQLKALAPAKDAALFDKLISTPNEAKSKTLNHRASLLDRMKAEDGEATETPKKFTFPNITKLPDGETPVGSWAIVPSKKQGSANLWRKLSWRRKKGNAKKPPFSFPSR